MKKILLKTACLFGILLAGCGGGVSHSYENRKADDAISHIISETLTEADVYYQGQSITSDNAICYSYLFHSYEEKPDTLINLVDAANIAIQQEKPDGKIEIFYSIIFPHTTIPVMSIRNYSSDEDTDVCPSLQNLQIWGTNIKDTIYNDPSTYSKLPGIKHLKIYRDMADITEREDINWYEYFPDLETLEIISEEKGI